MRPDFASYFIPVGSFVTVTDFTPVSASTSNGMPSAFPATPATNVTDEMRFSYSRVVSAGPDGVLDTPCFAVNVTNSIATAWTERSRRLARQAGLIDGDDRSARGDDIVLFLCRTDMGEGVLR